MSINAVKIQLPNSIRIHLAMNVSQIVQTKLDTIEWIWSLSLITFSISFPSVLRRIMGQSVFRELYASLFGLGW